VVGDPIIHTVGHSNHTIEDFIALIGTAGITAIADVRSAPYSRRNPGFNREVLRDVLSEHGIAYVWLGNELGARPSDPSLRRSDGSADYGRIAAGEAFLAGVERVLDGARRYRVALMCAERDPLDCHRTILVSRHLASLGINPRHVLADGGIVDHEEIESQIFDRVFPKGVDLFSAEKGKSSEQAYDALATRMTVPRSRR
jgi:uncharacterized protein (DUF488 family)